ncbi:conserved hypothetical protein [Paecilomyces variotii No. 5]|uniref:Uncharacterized protein n=1 Tax=Byssochlamys spectabilis (strain No. 5 / NBRC 109023) TaxID=1356009 RepID=V5G901_BYSSN|nr:conserved hypothetical protein [Paecilomyces variotii No. 5]
MRAALGRDCRQSETLGGFDYGLDENEGQSFLIDQEYSSELVQALEERAASLSPVDFRTESDAQGTVTITTDSAALEPDLRYIIYIIFPHRGLDLAQVAQAFTAEFLRSLPSQKSIHFVFSSLPDPSLSSVLSFHRDLISSRPEMTVGTLQTALLQLDNASRRVRCFPMTRCEDERYNEHREPYRIFGVLLDRPDFLTASGALFLLSDGNKIKSEGDEDDGIYRDYKETQIWRSVGIPAVAQRLAGYRPKGMIA